jgi:GDP-L-fucose synthase
MLLAYQHGLGRGPFNIGSGRSYTIRDLVDAIVASSGLAPKVLWDDSKPEGEPRKVANIARARTQLGFAPAVELADGIARTIAWYRAAREAGTAIRL